jgi:hypothetical protein
MNTGTKELVDYCLSEAKYPMGLVAAQEREHREWVKRMVMEKHLGEVNEAVEKKHTSTVGQGLSDPKQRKETPIASGVLDYFPDAIREVARVSFIGNEQHNPGTPLHWDRSKSKDHSDCMMRHYLERGTVDGDGGLHTAKMVWRALAMLQEEIENRK